MWALLSLHRILICCALLLGVGISGCAASSAQVGPTPTAPAPSLPTASLAPLGPPPLDCPVKPPPQARDFVHFGNGSDTHFLGGGPVWISAPNLPSTLHLGAMTSWKIVVDVGPNYPHAVSLQIRDLGTHEVAEWLAGNPPHGVTQRLTLDPQQQDPEPQGPAALHAPPEPGWNEWGTFPQFSTAGCYRLEVAWAEGQWQSTFAVGQ